MTMSEPLPAQGSLPMELPSMSSPGASRAKTFPSPESSAAWAKAPVPASGPRLSDLLATYDRATSSWRTSQHCLLAQVNGEADGLAEFSETWPSAGMMRNGKTYRRQPWALPIAESASGLFATPAKTSGHASDAEKGWWSGTSWYRPDGSKKQTNLLDQVRMWPTPTKSMHKGSIPASLTRRDGQDRSNDRLDHALQALEGSGALNPTWVEWLMGFPTSHTDLQPLATL